MKAWWLRLARSNLLRDPRTREVLGRDLAERVGRAQAWNHSIITDFANGRAEVTDDLAKALQLEYRLPPPVLYPRSYEEAVALANTSEKYDVAAVPEEVDREVTPLPKPRERARPLAKSGPGAERRRRPRAVSSGSHS